ncbi:hypothetical protein EDB85DRAFT_1581367 [Lactarius pseudohatsudake]|nr:hypothetical protein EDB85DRAFT_1581367 [Lactarius pseudohatsudake]
MWGTYSVMKSSRTTSNLPLWMAPEDAVSLLASFGAEDIVIFTKEVLRYQCISHRSANVVGNTRTCIHAMMPASSSISESKSKFRSLLSSCSCSSSSRIISLTGRPTAKSFKAWGVVGQAHVSAVDLEDEADPRLEDADEDEEEEDGANGNNDK